MNKSNYTEDFNINSILKKVVFINIETTGLENSLKYNEYSKWKEILEITAVKIKSDGAVKFQVIVNPKNKYPLNIFDASEGLTQQELDRELPIEEVLKGFIEFIGDYPLISHNGSFEKSFLSSYAKKLKLNMNNEFLDSIELLALLEPSLKDYNLDYLIKKYVDTSVVENPKALEKVEHTIEVVNYFLINFWQESGYAIPMEFTYLNQWSWYKYLLPLSKEEIKGFLRVHNLNLNSNKTMNNSEIHYQKYEELFREVSLWSKNGRSYTVREQQIKASKHIKEGFQNENITLIEAPTGLGKSLAYLLPAVIHSLLKGEKIIVSTNTKGLQSQLVEKDMPSLLEVLNLKDKIKFTLIKGKSNYLCLERFNEISELNTLKQKLGHTFLNRYMKVKGFGDIEEINTYVKDLLDLSPLIEQCFCDSELCNVNKCKYSEECFYAQKVEALKESNIIIINHSLLLMWPYQSELEIKNLVIDEAHNLTKEIYAAYESQFNSMDLLALIDDIYNVERKSGYLFYLLRKAPSKVDYNDINNYVKKLKGHVENIGKSFQNYIRVRGISREYNIKEHLKLDNIDLKVVYELLKELGVDLYNFIMELEKAVNIFNDIASLEKDLRLKILKQRIDDITNVRDIIENSLRQAEQNYCYSFEVDRSFKWWKISFVPLDVSGIFSNKILKSINSCLFISATLTVNGNYNNFKRTLGIDFCKENGKTVVEVEPMEPVFDYKRNSVIYAPPDFNAENITEFTKKLTDFVLSLVNKIHGNIIILFTSIRRLESFNKAVALEMNSLGIEILTHKNEIEKLKARTKRYIFLGSRGFFEGVDVPGDSVNCIILDKVPNINSKEPFYKSLIEYEMKKAESKDKWPAYFKINYPIVSIDLKQIYGRLIRTEYDYGSFFIMSKFENEKPNVRKLEKELHGVKILRKDINEDLQIRYKRWKVINLFKILKEVKEAFSEEVANYKQFSKSKEEDFDFQKFINDFLNKEFEKRKLKYDMEIIIDPVPSIRINGENIRLNEGWSKILFDYFSEVIKR